MKITGTARGRNLQELMTDAHRQAKQFYGEKEYVLKTSSPRAATDYHHLVDGSAEPIRTSFDMEFEAAEPNMSVTIQEGQ